MERNYKAKSTAYYFLCESGYIDRFFYLHWCTFKETDLQNKPKSYTKYTQRKLKNKIN